jgi:hypothetical protein
MFENILLLFGALSAIWYGIYGLLYSIIVVNILVTSVNAFFSGKLINYGLFFQIRDLYPSFLIAGITGFVTFYISTKLLFEYSDILKIFISGIIYASFYLSISLLMKVQAIQDFKSLIKKN